MSRTRRIEERSSVEGFVLAGGQSTRMGADKALIEIEGVPMVVRTARILEPHVQQVTVVGPPERLTPLGLRAIPDDAPELGPLGGIATALRHSESEWNLIVACDLPFLTGEWLASLIGKAIELQADALIPEGQDGLEPLCAVYHRRCAPRVRSALERGVRKVTDGLADCIVRRWPWTEWKGIDSAQRLFKNMNTPEDYEEARGWLARRRDG